MKKKDRCYFVGNVARGNIKIDRKVFSDKDVSGCTGRIYFPLLLASGLKKEKKIVEINLWDPLWS